MGLHSAGEGSSKSKEKPSKERTIKKFAMKASSIKFTPLQTKSSVIKSSLGEDIIVTQNSYNVGDKSLSDFDEDETMSGIFSEIQSIKNIQNSQQKKEKTNPIIISNKNVTMVQNLCYEVIESKKFELSLLSIGVKVEVPNKYDFEMLKEKLIAEKVPFYMYHTPATRPRKIVLYGLEKMKIDDLKAALAEVNIHPTDIKTLHLRENKLNYDNQCLYLLYFKAGSIKLAELRAVRSIRNIIVKWAPYEPRAHNKYPQCRNCQMYGHSSVNCYLPTRCLVCADSHKTDACPKKLKRAVIEHKKQSNESIDKSFVKCANCGGNHPANYKGCQSYETYKQIQLKSRKQTVTRKKPPQYKLNQEDFPDLPTHSPYNQHNGWSQQQQQSQNTGSNLSNMDNMQQFMCSMMTTVNNLIDKLSKIIEQFASMMNNSAIRTP